MERLSQPDFEGVARGFEAIGAQMRLCENLPVVRTSEDIQRRFDRLEEGLVEARRERREQFDQLLAAVQELKTSSLARDENEDARVFNRDATKPESSIRPLRDVRSNQEIPGFPRTVAELSTLNATEAARILEALGLSQGGSLAERRKRIRLKTGSTLTSTV